MSDRELLERAAKAAGIPHDGVGYVSPTGLPMNWNPLTDDGDALRLAGKLRLRISISHEFEFTEVAYFREFRQKRASGGVVEQWGNDRDAATRRAIVRAAAKIVAQPVPETRKLVIDCARQLREAGLPYTRTCMRCKLGPCTVPSAEASK